MRRIILLILIIAIICIPVSAMEFHAPSAPDIADPYMPVSTSSFAKDLWYIVKRAVSELNPHISDAIEICVRIMVTIMLISILENFSGVSAKTVSLAGVIAISTTLLTPSGALVRLGVETVESISEYGKLLIPTMTAALAAEGATVTSTALYTGTVLFNTVLTVAITKLLIPMLYAFIALSIAKVALGENVLTNLQAFVKWLITWTLKISIYLFTGYLGITGVISGSVDAAAVKAAKLTISGAIPVVGNIISDASETILVNAGIMKNAAGTYGLLAIIATCIGPFLQIGVQYLSLRITAVVSGVFGCKQAVSLVECFSTAMGFLVAMTGTVCLLLLISTVCFMKGVG